MAQSFLNDPSQFLPEEPAPKRYGIWFWIKQTVLFPFRLLGLMLVLGMLIGGVGMWVIPDLAERYKVDMLLLVFRILDEEGPGRPFRQLGYQDKIHAGLVDLRPGQKAPVPGDPPLPPSNDRLSDEVVNVTVPRTSGDEAIIRYASGQTQKVSLTTPHTTVPAAELAAARKAINRLFPTRNRKLDPQVVSWGESLFVTSWVQKYNFKVAPRDRFGPGGGTEDEQLWCAWQVLRCGGAPEEDLFHLPELFRATFPEKEDQKTALAWANTLYQRLDNAFRMRQKDYAIAHRQTVGAYTSFQRVVPPDTEWSRLWLLQQYVGLSPAAREAARQRWLGFFPANKEEQVLALGASLAEERRGKKEALPNVPDVLPALCVIERLTGRDHDGQVCTEMLGKVFVDRNLLAGTIQMAYPNDDLFYLLATGDKLELFPIQVSRRGEWIYYFVITIFLLVITGLATLGIQTAIQWFAARLFLRKSVRPLWEKHLEGRGEEPWYLAVVGVVLLAGVGTLTAPFSIAEIIAVQISSPYQLFIGALLATAFGGLLIATCRRLAALFLVACGVDIEETWADEILGIIFGALVLYHFGNDLIAITLFALSDFLPGLLFIGIHRLLHRRRHAAPVIAQPSPSPRVTPAIPAFPASSVGGRRWPS
jgi:hypothetical protein